MECVSLTSIRIVVVCVCVGLRFRFSWWFSGDHWRQQADTKSATLIQLFK